MCLSVAYSFRFQFFRTSFLARNREHLSTPSFPLSSFPLSIFTSGRLASAIRRTKKVVKLKTRMTHVLHSVLHVRGRQLPSQICAQVCGSIGPTKDTRFNTSSSITQVVQLVKKFPVFYGTQKFITVQQE